MLSTRVKNEIQRQILIEDMEKVHTIETKAFTRQGKLIQVGKIGGKKY